jgi:hypothetical protein
MQVTRTTTFVDGNVLTASALNGEFNNLLNAPNIVNADISSNAAIAYSKLNLTGNITNADIADNAAIASSKLALVINRAFTWYLPDTEIVRNGAGAFYIAPEAMTVVKIWYICTSGTATIRINGGADGTTEIASGMNVSSTLRSKASAFTSTAIAAGDLLNLDITAASSPVGITVTMEVTQP